MQLEEQIQQHLTVLPVELKAEVLDFVLFLEQKQAKQARENIKKLMEAVPSSVSLADELIAERRLEAEKEKLEMRE